MTDDTEKKAELLAISHFFAKKDMHIFIHKINAVSQISMEAILSHDTNIVKELILQSLHKLRSDLTHEIDKTIKEIEDFK